MGNPARPFPRSKSEFDVFPHPFSPFTQRTELTFLRRRGRKISLRRYRPPGRFPYHWRPLSGEKFGREERKGFGSSLEMVARTFFRNPWRSMSQTKEPRLRFSCGRKSCERIWPRGCWSLHNAISTSKQTEIFLLANGICQSNRQRGERNSR